MGAKCPNSGCHEAANKLKTQFLKSCPGSPVSLLHGRTYKNVENSICAKKNNNLIIRLLLSLNSRESSVLGYHNNSVTQNMTLWQHNILPVFRKGMGESSPDLLMITSTVIIFFNPNPDAAIYSCIT